MPSPSAPATWTVFDFTLTPLAKDIFASAASVLFGAKYTPLAFASRGNATASHYCFLCDAEYASPPANGNLVLIYIHLPESGLPYLYRTVPVDP